MRVSRVERLAPRKVAGLFCFYARPNDTHADINAVNRVESGGHPILLVGFGQLSPAEVGVFITQLSTAINLIGMPCL
jgi:hypothetical protein